jgi:hypothetical protein
MAPDIDLASLPSDSEATLGYGELYALWKADEEAFNRGQRVTDAEYLFWMARVRQHLTLEELPVFEYPPGDGRLAGAEVSVKF